MMWVWPCVLIISLLFIPRASESLGPQITATSCQLDWVAPTNSDGSAVADLTGYQIFLRRESGTYDLTKPIASPTKNELQVRCPRLGALALGQWFLIMRSRDSTSNLYAPSVEVPFEVVLPPPPHEPLPPPTGVTIR